MILNLIKMTFVSILAYLFFFVVSASATTDKIQPGQSDMIFDKAFLQSIKNVVLYERIVKIVGVPAVKVGEASFKIPGEKYHWNGKENTSFNIRVISGKVIDGNVKTPDGRFISLDISLEGNGEINELGK
ncbi:MAG: hypothetical protein PHF56_06945 [Desulfuromonadaceae bacterium]|nr:hypothetical protein [Desulfuromonadaceae bacterium]